MRKVSLVRGARQLLTLRGPSGPRRGADLRNLGLIQDGAVLVVDGVIREVGPSRRLENLAEARYAGEIDASGRVVMPGFVDSHTHIVGGPARALDHEAEAGNEILALARVIQESSPRTLEAQALRAVEEAVRHGTTMLEAKCGFGLTEAGEIKILRVQSALLRRPFPVVSTFFTAQVPPEFQQRPDEYVNWLCAHLLPLLKHRKLAEFVDIRCDPAVFTLEQVRRYLTTAKELGFELKMHAGRGLDDRMARLAVELGVTSVDHVTDVTAEGAAILAQSPTIATLLPGTTFYLGTQGYAPARLLIDSGVAVALATNYNPETSPSQNMQMMITLACRKMNLTPAEAVAASTINAAHALRRADRAGSIEAGKSADLLILRVPDYREIPYHFGVNLVDLVMRNGTAVVHRTEVMWPAN